MKKFKLTYLLLFILLTAPSTPASTQGRSDNNIIKGLASYELKQYDSAIYYFSAASENMKQYPYSYLYYGISLLESGQTEMAINELLKAEKEEKGKASFWISKAYARAGNINKSLEYLEINLSSSFREPERIILLDKDLQKFENNETWKAFRRNTNYYSAYDQVLSEADYLINSGNYPDALLFLNENLNKGFRKSQLYARRSIVYESMKNFRMAIEDLNKAIEGDRRNFDLLVQRASLNMKLERYKQALEDYDLAIKIDPYKFKLYPQRAVANNYNGAYEAAINDMNYYLSFFPEDHSAWYKFGLIHSINQKYFNALDCFNKALQINQSKAEYFAARGDTYLQTRTFRYASNDFSMALDLNPVNPKVYLNKGIASLNLGNLKEACFCFELAKKQGALEADNYLQKHCGQ